MFSAILACAALISPAGHGSEGGPSQLVVWQPSHQTDTGEDFNEAKVCDAIVESAMSSQPRLDEHKVWSLGVPGLHHSDSGTNTKIADTSAITDGKPSGYAYELAQANRLRPRAFVAVHNNGGTGRHAVWGYVHAGDGFEAANRELARSLIAEIRKATNLENGGVLADDTTGRNDYRCRATGALAFYSLDENVNAAHYRVLLEIGDNRASRDFLLDRRNQERLGAAIKRGLVRFLSGRH